MRYDYKCRRCNYIWEMSLAMADRDLPTRDSCPHCDYIGVVERQVCAPSVSYDGGGIKSVVRRAGDGWNDVLTKVKKQSGRDNTIHVN